MTGLNWVRSRTVGGVSEIAVLAPIRKGSVVGERRTHEEQLRDLIGNLARRHEAGLPTELDPVPSIHFGRMLILRPEHYLRSAGGEAGEGGVGHEAPVSSDPFDEYVERPIVWADEVIKATQGGVAQPPGGFVPRSWLLVLVEFDGDLRTYLRDIAQKVKAFDAIFDHCDHFPGTRDFDGFWLWIKRYQIAVDLLYTRYPDLSVVRLKYLEAFKHRFDAFVAQVRSPAGPRVRSLDDALDAFLRENQQIAVAFPSASGVYPPIGD